MATIGIGICISDNTARYRYWIGRYVFPISVEPQSLLQVTITHPDAGRLLYSGVVVGGEHVASLSPDEQSNQTPTVIIYKLSN